MTYIDNARIRFGGTLVCHLMADTLQELHATAEKIGLKPLHFNSQTSTPHYTVAMARRAAAIAAGAKPLNNRAAVLAVFDKFAAQRGG